MILLQSANTSKRVRKKEKLSQRNKFCFDSCINKLFYLRYQPNGNMSLSFYPFSIIYTPVGFPKKGENMATDSSEYTPFV